MNRGLLLSASLPLMAFAAEEERSFQEFNTFNNMGIDSEKITRTFVGQVKGRYDITGNASVDHGHLQFAEGDAAISLIHLATPTLIYSVSLGYQNTWMDLDPNPFFNQTIFQNGYLSFGIKQDPSKCWSYQAEISINVDLVNFGDHSTLYLYGGWGRYQVNDSFATSVGFIGRSGIRQDRFWPVIGFEWDINDTWTINFVYPVNMAVIYNLDENWALATVVRVINSRHRIGPNEPLSNGIWEYRNVGVELALNYNIGLFFSANVHVGALGHGDLKIANYRDRHPVYYEPDLTPYAGAGLSLRF